MLESKLAPQVKYLAISGESSHLAINENEIYDRLPSTKHFYL